jgi:two-component system cell cycle sensor histidine kinase/response regulator CckA
VAMWRLADRLRVAWWLPTANPVQVGFTITTTQRGASRLSRTLSMTDLMSLARPHYLRWVRAGVLVIIVGYGLSAASTMMTSTVPLTDGLPELLVVLTGIIGLALLGTGRVKTVAWIVQSAVWLEIQHGFYHAGSVMGAGATALPAFVIGTALFAGERMAVGVALVTAVVAPLAAMTGRMAGHPLPSWSAQLEPDIVLMVVVLGVAYLMALALRAFASVLATAEAGKRRFAELVQNIPDGIVALDGEGNIMSLNPAAVQLLDVQAAECEHRPLERVLRSCGAQPAPAKWLANRGSLQAVTFDRAGSRPVLAEVLTQDVLRDDGSGGSLVMLRDVTEKRRAEERQAELREQLQQAQRMEALGHFAGGMAHDFNNVLHVVLGNLDLAALRVGTEHPALRHLEEIRKATTRAGALVQQLLAYARRQASAPRKIDLNSVVTNLGPLLRPLVPENIALEWSLSRGPATVCADPAQIEQVVVNLVVNARDAMPNGGLLRIATVHRELDYETAQALDLVPGGYVALLVTDSGMGMTPEVRARLFEPFFTTKKDGHGTGLGLATVFGIVKQAEGHIYAESEVGRGTTFHVLLPHVEGPADPERATPASSAHSPRGTETILLVEDEPQVRELNVTALKGLGYRVLEAVDGHDALRTAAEATEPIHILVSDVIMPRLGGRELAQRVRATRPEIRILFASGYAKDVIAQDGIVEPGIHLLSKPFSPQDLAFRVRELLDGVMV